MSTPMLEWGAQRISDPVARLKFLRENAARAVDIEEKIEEKIEQIEEKSPRYRKWALWGAAALITMLTAGVATFNWTRRAAPVRAPAQSVNSKPLLVETLPATLPNVWLVETRGGSEVYSNGLRVEDVDGAVSEGPRRYLPLPRKSPELWLKYGESPNAWSDQPVGIVFHTTESHMEPFDVSHTNTIKRLGKNLLSFIRHQRAYHYLVDRFGRVYRAVDEASFANHAGYSVWADRESVFVNLNQSFIGVAFEAQSRPQDGSESITQAQIHAGRVLTDMLRSRYKIRPENCTTHAQVSVNPDNFGIGAHTDWANDFPYADMGLPDNYTIPLPSAVHFGFIYDQNYVRLSEAKLWQGLLFADEEIRTSAEAQKRTPERHRAILRQRYKDLLQTWKK